MSAWPVAAGNTKMLIQDAIEGKKIQDVLELHSSSTLELQKYIGGLPKPQIVTVSI
jgi:hypothetical protein